MPRRKLPQPDARAANALNVIRAGASDEDAMAYARISRAEWDAWSRTAWGDELRTARAQTAILAAGVVTQAAARDVNVAQRLADRAAGRHELERLKAISRVGE